MECSIFLRWFTYLKIRDKVIMRIWFLTYLAYSYTTSTHTGARCSLLALTTPRPPRVMRQSIESYKDMDTQLSVQRATALKELRTEEVKLDPCAQLFEAGS